MVLQVKNDNNTSTTNSSDPAPELATQLPASELSNGKFPFTLKLLKVANKCNLI